MPEPNVHYIRKEGGRMVMYMDDWLTNPPRVLKITASNVKVKMLDHDRPWQLDAKLMEDEMRGGGRRAGGRVRGPAGKRVEPGEAHE